MWNGPCQRPSSLQIPSHWRLCSEWGGFLGSLQIAEPSCPLTDPRWTGKFSGSTRKRQNILSWVTCASEGHHCSSSLSKEPHDKTPLGQPSSLRGSPGGNVWGQVLTCGHVAQPLRLFLDRKDGDRVNHHKERISGVVHACKGRSMALRQSRNQQVCGAFHI